MATNWALRHASELPSLVALRIDRTRKVNRKGLWELAHLESRSRTNLRVFHMGVFKHQHFDKVDVAKFFASMPALREFSLRDETRATVKVNLNLFFSLFMVFMPFLLIQIGNLHCEPIGECVLTYSVLRMAIIQAEKSHREQRARHLMDSCSSSHDSSSCLDSTAEDVVMDQDDESGCDFYFPSGFRCNLEEIKVVDRQLKPRYLLLTCPNLKRLYIDWQVSSRTFTFEFCSFPQH